MDDQSPRVIKMRQEVEALNNQLKAMGFQEEDLIKLLEYQTFPTTCENWVVKCKKAHELLGENSSVVKILYHIYGFV